MAPAAPAGVDAWVPPAEREGRWAEAELRRRWLAAGGAGPEAPAPPPPPMLRVTYSLTPRERAEEGEGPAAAPPPALGAVPPTPVPGARVLLRSEAPGAHALCAALSIARRLRGCAPPHPPHPPPPPPPPPTPPPPPPHPPPPAADPARRCAAWRSRSATRSCG